MSEVCLKLTIITLILIQKTYGITRHEFYPFGSENGDAGAPTNDDGSTPRLSLSSLFPFFGEKHDSIYINTNGIISFSTAFSTHTPAVFPLNCGRQLIAPYWCDIDTTNNGGNIWYRESLNHTLLALASTEIKELFPEVFNFQASSIFIATWSEVAFYGSNAKGREKRCTFQCILITDGSRSFAVFMYERIEWTTGTASSGNASTGLGGTPALVGFDAGDRTNFFMLAASRTPAIIDVTSISNIGVPGKFAFRIDSSVLVNGRMNLTGYRTAIHDIIGDFEAKVKPHFIITDSKETRYIKRNIK